MAISKPARALAGAWFRRGDIGSHLMMHRHPRQARSIWNERADGTSFQTRCGTAGLGHRTGEIIGMKELYLRAPGRGGALPEGRMARIGRRNGPIRSAENPGLRWLPIMIGSGSPSRRETALGHLSPRGRLALYRWMRSCAKADGVRQAIADQGTNLDEDGWCDTEPGCLTPMLWRERRAGTKWRVLEHDKPKIRQLRCGERAYYCSS